MYNLFACWPFLLVDGFFGECFHSKCAKIIIHYLCESVPAGAKRVLDALQKMHGYISISSVCSKKDGVLLVLTERFLDMQHWHALQIRSKICEKL